jgi:hypothetical protein
MTIPKSIKRHGCDYNQEAGCYIQKLAQHVSVNPGSFPSALKRYRPFHPTTYSPPVT